jgi:hypothetical protein
MARVYVNIDKNDLKQVREMFERMADKGKGILHEAVNKGAEYLEPKIKNSIKTGNDDDNTHLRDTVRMGRAKPSKKAKQTAVIRIGGIKDVEYPMHLETGHMTEDGRHIPARPYIRSTADEHQAKVADIVIDYIFDSLGMF